MDTFANNEDPDDKLLQNAVLNQGLHCLLKPLHYLLIQNLIPRKNITLFLKYEPVIPQYIQWALLT